MFALSAVDPWFDRIKSKTIKLVHVFAASPLSTQHGRERAKTGWFSTKPTSLQDSDNPDLRDRGYIYWRLLSTDPAAAKEVVLAEKPLISEETDLIEPTLLDE
jgi:hypothetical protein